MGYLEDLIKKNPKLSNEASTVKSRKNSINTTGRTLKGAYKDLEENLLNNVKEPSYTGGSFSLPSIPQAPRYADMRSIEYGGVPSVPIETIEQPKGTVNKGWEGFAKFVSPITNIMKSIDNTLLNNPIARNFQLSAGDVMRGKGENPFVGVDTNKPITTGIKPVDWVTEQAGRLSGAVMMGDMSGLNGVNTLNVTDDFANNLAQKAINKTGLQGASRRVASNVLGGALEGSLGNVAEGLLAERDIKDIGNEAWQGALFGGLLRGGIGETKNLINNAKRNLPSIEGLDFRGDIKPIKSPKVETPINADIVKIEPPIKTPKVEKPNADKYISQRANELLGDLDNTIKSQAHIFTDSVNAENPNISTVVGTTTTKRVTSDGVATLLNIDSSYDNVRKAIEDVSNGVYKDTKLNKAVRELIDYELSNGYTDGIYGFEFPRNTEYLLNKGSITIDDVKAELNTVKSAVNDIVDSINMYADNPDKVGKLMDKLELLQENEKQLQQLIDTSDLNSRTDILPSTDVNTPINDLNANTKAIEPTKKVSEFKTNSLENSPLTQSEEMKKLVEDLDATYDVKSNQQSFERATADVANNVDEVINRIKTEGIRNAEDSVASGIITRQLINEAEKTGDYAKVNEWLKIVRPQVTDLGQSLQALSTWKRMTLEGTLLKAQRVVDSATERIKKANPKKFAEVEKAIKANPSMADELLKQNGIPTLGNEDIKFITEIMTKVENMADGREKDIEFAKVKKLIADKVPPTVMDKTRALQRINLLLNTKTMIRNPLGNVVLGTLENIKDLPGTVIDKAISTKTGQRTTSIPSISTQAKGMIKGTKEAIEDYKLGVDTSPTSGQFDIPDSQAFRKGFLGKAEKATNFGLSLGDRPFWQGAYDDTVRALTKANNLEKPTQEILDQARKVADDKTFQNVTTLSESFKKLQKSLNFGREFGLGNIVLPFVKTPANILDKAIDYTPIGGVKGVTKIINGLKTGNFDQKKAVDQLARGLTGSTLIALGYKLAESGVLNGKGASDYEAQHLQKQAGKLPYAIKVGNTYNTIDWAQPAAIPLMIGADIFDEGKSKKKLDSIIAQAVVTGGSTLFDQSLLQGLSKLFGGYSQSGGKNLVEGLGESAMQIPQQFLPFNSALNQVAKLTDKQARDTYSDSKVSMELNKAKNKIPGLSKQLPNKVDTLGRDIGNYNDSKGLKYGFDVLFNPGQTATYNPSEAEKMVIGLYDKTGEVTQFPRIPKVPGLTSQQKQELQRYVGNRTNEEFTKLAESSYFNALDDTEKIKKLQNLLTKIMKEGKDKIK